MAVTRRATSSVVSAANGTSVVVPKPTGATAGDLLLVFFSFNQNSVTVTAPDDSWMVYLRGQDAATSGGICTWMAWAKVAATDGTDYTFTASVSGGFAAVATAYYSSTGEDVNIYAPAYQETAAGTSNSTKSLTTLANNDVVVSMFACDLAGSDDWVASSPGGLTELADVEDHTFSMIGVFEETRAAAGAGAHTVTKTDATLGANAYIVALTETGSVKLHGVYRSNSLNPTTGTFFLPDRFSTGDVAVFVWYTRDTTKTFTKDSNVTTLFEASETDAGRLYVGYRWLTSGDADPTWTSSSVATSDTFWAVLVFRNAAGSPGSPFLSSSVPFAYKNQIQPVSQGTVSVRSGLAVTLFGKNNDFVNTIETGEEVQAPPPGFLHVVSNMATDGNDGSYGVAIKKVGAEVVRPGEWTLGGGAATDDSLVWTGVLNVPSPASVAWTTS